MAEGFLVKHNYFNWIVTIDMSSLRVQVCISGIFVIFVLFRCLDFSVDTPCDDVTFYPHPSH